MLIKSCQQRCRLPNIGLLADRNRISLDPQVNTRLTQVFEKKGVSVEWRLRRKVLAIGGKRSRVSRCRSALVVRRALQLHL